MFLRDYDCSADFGADRSKRDAIEGFASIAAELDRGVDAIGNGSKVGDLLAIGLGWLLLLAVIFYPSLQLAAFAICIAFMSVRTFVHSIFQTGDADSGLAYR
jgi:hypothetical protein